MHETKNERERLLNVTAVSEWLDVPKSWLYGKVHNQSLPFPHTKVGAYLRFPEGGVREYIEQQTQPVGGGVA